MKVREAIILAALAGFFVAVVLPTSRFFWRGFLGVGETCPQEQLQ